LAATEAAAEWRSVSVRYPYEDRPVVDSVSISLRQGERLLLLGPSGSGKSTLLHTLTGLVPRAIPAHVEGEVLLAGQPVSRRSPAEWADTVAFLFQNADETLCGMTVEDEIAFPLENRRAPEPDIRAAIDNAMRRLDLPTGWRTRRSATLSGGERQLVAIAAALAQAAPILVADEPTASLAPEAAAKLHDLISEHAGSVLIVDHRLDGLIRSIDRVVLLDRTGRIAAEGEPRRFFRDHRETLDALGVWRPHASRLDQWLADHGLSLDLLPLTVDEALAQLPAPGEPAFAAAVQAVREFVQSCAPEFVSAAGPDDGTPLLALHDAACAPLLGPVVLRDVSLSVRRGEVVAVLGRNGAGKSTLAASLAGLLRLKGGRRDGPVAGMAFQNPESQFTAGSVREELEVAVPQRGAETEEAVETLLAHWGLEALARRHPFELSHGQKRRLALATLACGDWPCLVLDEPTAGLDATGADVVAGDVRDLARRGRAIVIVTHYMEFAERLCPRAVVVGDGSILFDGAFAALASDAALLDRAGLREPASGPARQWLERNGQC
jgi:energy-coupling factor transporter ATP-binding protein EcfA2